MVDKEDRIGGNRGSHANRHEPLHGPLFFVSSFPCKFREHHMPTPLPNERRDIARWLYTGHLFDQEIKVWRSQQF